MVVLRLIGDQWTFLDRYAVAIKPMESFKARLADIQKTLKLESFVGYAIYRTEGDHPNLIRPTVPIDINSSLQKENLILGAQVVVYIKQANLEQQSNDIIFHKGLLHYRKENKIKGVAKDGSDVKAYIQDLSTRLNIDDSADIAEHETQKRGRIEGEEHRAYWVLTFEFREIQALKDKEAEVRDELLAEYREALSVIYTVYIKLPRLQSDERVARDVLEKAFEESLASISTNEQKQRPKPPRPATPPPPAPELPPPPPQQVIVAGGGMSKEDMEAIVATMQSLIANTQQQSHEMLVKMQSDFTSVVESLATDMRKSASEIQQLRAVVQGTSNDEKAALLQIEMEVTRRLEKERERVLNAKVQLEKDRAQQISHWMGPRNAESVDMAKKLLAEQNESLRALIYEEDAMIEQQMHAMKSIAQGYELGLYSEALNSVAVDQSIQGMHIAQTQLAIELERVTAQLRRLEQEKQKRIEEEKEMDRQKMLAAQQAEELALAGRTTTVITNGFCSVVSGRGIFSYDAIHQSRHTAVFMLPIEIERMLLLFIKTFVKPEELHFMVTSRDVALGIQQEAIPTIDVDALASSYLSSLIVEFGGSYYEINDQLVWAFSIPAHPHRALFLRRLEESHTTRYLELSVDAEIQENNGRRRATPMDFIPFIDIFLALYEGREVELILSMCPELASGNPASGGGGEQWVCAPGDCSYYYYTSIPDLSQWERPAALA